MVKSMNKDKINALIKLVDEYSAFEFSKHENQLDTLFDSMRYSLKNGGKRVRPVLAFLFCEACGGNASDALPLACAVEYIHTYSLIHDDLPCMDNDDYRRGKPSNHKVYGEATALLAGDSLLTYAFEIIYEGHLRGCYSAETAIESVGILSHLAGAYGMAGGQLIDLESEGKSVSLDTLKLMDELKTGALIKPACLLGCTAAGASYEQKKAAEAFADNIGLAFQIKDDILDVTSTAEKLGKPIGSDAANDKSTYVGLLGLEPCKKLVEELTDKAMQALSAFKNNSELIAYAEYLCNRES